MKKINDFIVNFNKISLKSKFIVIVIMAIFIPMLTIIIIMSGYIKKIMINQVVVSVESTVNQISNNIDEMIKGQIYSISGIVMNDSKIYSLLTDEYNDGAVQKYIDTLEIKNKINSGYGRMYQDINLAAIIGKNNVLYNLSLPTYENEELLLKTLEIKESTKDIGISINWDGLNDNIFTNRKTNNIRDDRVIIVTMNIFMPKTGEYIGMQIYTIPESIIYEKYKNTDVAQNGNVFILNHSGHLISSTVEEYVSDTDKFNQAYSGRISDNSFNIQSYSMMTDMVSTLNLWQTIGEIPTTYVTSKVNNAFNIFWVVIFWFVAVCLVAFIFLSEKVIRPIKEIIASMKKFEMGEMKSYVEANGESELGLLEAYYNRMIDKINHHIVHEYEMDKQKKQLEYDVLMSQINSHFLSNTLESIVWEARAAGAMNVAKMASSLGRFFRLSSSKGNMFVLVEEEVAHINAYVGIQKIRYGNKFDFFLNMENTPNIGKLKTLKILLQPLVENSIIHAIDTAEHIVIIELKIYTDSDMLIFEVTDDGGGIEEQNLKKIKENLEITTNKNKNIGLKNVRERIKLYFGYDYPKADLIVESKVGEGTKVKLIVPVIK